MRVSKRTLIKTACLLATAISVSSCTTFGNNQGGWFNPVTSIDAADLPPAVASAVAGDMVSKLTEQVGPGTGTISLKADKSQFGLALDSALRGSGYAVATANQKPGEDRIIPLSYTIGNGQGEILARLTTPSVELSRTYQATPEGATPSSPLSVLKRAN